MTLENITVDNTLVESLAREFKPNGCGKFCSGTARCNPCMAKFARLIGEQMVEADRKRIIEAVKTLI